MYFDHVSVSQPPFKQRVKEWLDISPTRTMGAVVSVFPIVTWLPKYNMGWFLGDLISGITIGTIVVPQSMAYAKIATLPPQYGLYTSVVGSIIYPLFATSKDITIGTTAIASLTVSQIIAAVQASHPDMTNVEIAMTLTILAGFVTLVLGVLHLGFLIDFIPGPAITGFMAGSAITIIVTQISKIFGIPNIDTRQPAYLIFGNTLKKLPETHIDLVIGALSLVFLYGMRYTMTKLMEKHPQRARPLFFLNISRNGILIVVTTLISYLVNMHNGSNLATLSPFGVLGNIPPGFQHLGVPQLSNTSVISAVVGQLPSLTLVLLLEQLAVAKSFGRINDYTINVDQEIVTIGLSNVLGSFFGAYPGTGSFSRTAINAKSGVRTPLSGIFSAVIVILALYALTPVFQYIPNAALAAVITHAVGDLVPGYKQVKQLCRLSFWDFLVFWGAVITILFSTVEYGVYVSVGLALAVLLLRIARPRVTVLGRVWVLDRGWGEDEVPDQTMRQSSNTQPHSSRNDQLPAMSDGESDDEDTDFDEIEIDGIVYARQNRPKEIYVPIPKSQNHSVRPPPPAILAFRLEESLTFPNCEHIASKIIGYVKKNTRRGKELSDKPGERPWNDAYGGDSSSNTLLGHMLAAAERAKPKDGRNVHFEKHVLKAIVFDMAGCAHLDATGIQCLRDIQTGVNRYASADVQFYFSSISSRKVLRALAISGFAGALEEVRIEPKPEQGAIDMEKVMSSDAGYTVASSSSASPNTLRPVKEERDSRSIELIEVVATDSESEQPSPSHDHKGKNVPEWTIKFVEHVNKDLHCIHHHHHNQSFQDSSNLHQCHPQDFERRRLRYQFVAARVEDAIRMARRS
ncbi:hypothetical protein BZG36_02789 [Bifiguratus adelaidae]|uniref:STAS domain-containing protein n=1 Tax=Bifiguratus adelaidae TaxID=1938954 RepID=A0A261Y1F3_9FUNG|nr:hypothetical protein BZG36_02789 [Bifiguratus adelaidae]